MKKLLIVSLGLLFLGAMAMPASAFVFVFADVSKLKFVTVDETITIFKFATINVDVARAPDKAAESLALVNQDSWGNYACENCAEKDSLLDVSVNLNDGIIHANQASGNMYNQGNVIALAVDGELPPGPDGTGFANAEASVSQNMGLVWDPETGEFLYFPNVVNSAVILFRNAFIRASINDNEGVVGVNQGSGNINNQANVASIAVTVLGGVALSEADLGQHIAIGNRVFETDTDKAAEITGSILRNEGVIHVNQSSGNLANQGNNLSLSSAMAPQP